MEPNCFSQVRLPGSEMGREVGLVEPQGGAQSEGVGYWKSGCWHLEKGVGDHVSGACKSAGILVGGLWSSLCPFLLSRLFETSLFLFHLSVFLLSPHPSRAVLT